MPHPSRKHTISDISDLVSYPKRGNHNTPEEEARHTQTINNSKSTQTEDQPSTIQYEKISVKCAFKAKLNSYGGLDKLKARICVRGEI